jgi:MerR family transcriptional regulator, light-induced transcriptional regulator
MYDRFLSPRDLAAAIGVSESSLKRWADEGLVRVTRTAGGHRRIALRDAVNYIRQSGATIVHPESLGISNVERGGVAAPAEDADGFLVAALLGGEAASVRSALLARYVRGEPLGPVFDGPFAAALRQIGEGWKKGPEGIYLEHRTADTCLQGLNFLRSLLPAPSAKAPLAIGGAPESDPYQIPSLMAATVLAAEGWREINLGPNLPFAALIAAAREHKPRLLWLSFTSAEAARSSARELSSLEQFTADCGCQLVIGGQSIPGGQPGERRRMHHLSSMQALAAFARGLAAAKWV